MTRLELLAASWRTFKTGTLYKAWAVANPVEAIALGAYVTKLESGKIVDAPNLKTATGKALAGLVSLAAPRATLPLIVGVG